MKIRLTYLLAGHMRAEVTWVAVDPPGAAAEAFDLGTCVKLVDVAPEIDDVAPDALHASIVLGAGGCSHRRWRDDGMDRRKN